MIPFRGFFLGIRGLGIRAIPRGGPTTCKAGMLVEATRFAPVATLLFTTLVWMAEEEEGRPVRSLLSLLFLRTSVVYSLLCFLSSLDETSYSLLHFFSTSSPVASALGRPGRRDQPASQIHRKPDRFLIRLLCEFFVLLVLVIGFSGNLEAKEARASC